MIQSVVLTPEASTLHMKGAEINRTMKS